MGLFKVNLLFILVMVLGLVSVGARANRADEDAPTFHIQQIDPSFDSQKQAGPGVKVHSADELYRGEWKIPKVKTRDGIFYQAGLKKDIGTWDEMDKDVLFVTARDSNTEVLLKNYPKISKEKLLDLVKLAKEAPK